MPKSKVLSSEQNSERVRDDASGDSGEGEDDELPCVIGKSVVWQLFPDGLQGDFHLISRLELWLEFIVFFSACCLRRDSLSDSILETMDSTYSSQ